MFAATQYYADAFQYHPSLGRALIIRGTPCYPPWAWLSWQRRFPDRARRVFAAAETITCGGGLIAFMIVLAVFESALAFSAGNGIKCFLICQSLNQLEKAYGPDNAIVDNCHVRMAYAANRAETAKTISELMGQSTASERQRSRSGKGFLGAQSVSESEQGFARPLMTPDEVLRLPFEDALLFIGGLPPYRARKLMYYLDDRLAPRAGLPPPESRAQQRGELLARPCSEWEEAVAEAAPPASLSAIPVASKSTEPDDDAPAIPPPPMDTPASAEEPTEVAEKTPESEWNEQFGRPFESAEGTRDPDPPEPPRTPFRKIL